MIGGTVNISRSLWDDEAFGCDPFSEREAWIWMIADASWKPRKRRVGDYVVSLDRGQLAGSIRFFAKAWKWTPAKVQRFLDRVQKMDLIQRETDTGVTVITICKYNDYQSRPKASDTRPIQDRYTSDTNENKGEIRGNNPLPPKGDDDEPDRFDEFWSVYPHRNGQKKGKKPARLKWNAARKRGVSQQTMIDGARASHSMPDVKRGFPRDPVTWINQEGWDDDPGTARDSPGAPAFHFERFDRKSA